MNDLYILNFAVIELFKKSRQLSDLGHGSAWT